jgi:hypothetical protein
VVDVEVPTVRRARMAAGPILVSEHGSPVNRAERKLLQLRPSNLIWIMPAQGGFSIPCPVFIYGKGTISARINNLTLLADDT